MLTKVVTPEAEAEAKRTSKGASARKSASKRKQIRKPNAVTRLGQKRTKRILAPSVLKMDLASYATTANAMAISEPKP